MFLKNKTTVLEYLKIVLGAGEEVNRASMSGNFRVTGLSSMCERIYPAAGLSKKGVSCLVVW